MGGPNSGRYGGHPTIEQTVSLVLPASEVKRIRRAISGRSEPVGMWRGALVFGSGFEVKWTLTVSPAELAFEFSHPTRAPEPKMTTYGVRAISSPAGFGGRRWWWVCPRSGRRVFKLYLPLGGHQFWSREAYGLGYSSQRETRRDRLMRRARKLHRALGGDGQAIGQEDPPKPKGMRWSTYERKAEAWRAADDAANDAWVIGVMPLLRRHGFKV